MLLRRFLRRRFPNPSLIVARPLPCQMPLSTNPPTQTHTPNDSLDVCYPKLFSALGSFAINRIITVFPSLSYVVLAFLSKIRNSTCSEIFVTSVTYHKGFTSFAIRYLFSVLRTFCSYVYRFFWS
jgi:hypothetical protein